MEECFKCGISEQNAKLHSAISDKGIVKVCQRCSVDGDLPVFRKKETSLEIADRTAPVGGLLKEREKAFESMKAGRKNPAMSRQDVNLRELVDNNYKQNIETGKKAWPGVIRNFNWVIMRARRNKGFGQKPLAEAIGEPEVSIRMAESGVLPKEYVPFLRKLEKVLEVNLMDDHPFRLEEHKKMLDFKDTSSNRMTISDVKSMAKRKEIEMIKSQGILAKEREIQEAQELLDEPEKVEEKKEKPSFFKNIFSKKEKAPEVEEIEDSDSSIGEQSKSVFKFTSSTSSQSKDLGKFTSSVTSQSKDAGKSTSSTSSQNKELFRSDSPTPGRTKSVPKYRWQK